MDNKIIYKLITIILAVLFFTINVGYISAAKFSIVPNSGTVIVDKEFTTDITIDTEGETAILARAVLTFDPKLVKVVKAEHNASLFCSYPESLQSIDNVNGVIVITGFCQSGNGVGYKTADSADVFGRITYNVIDKGDIDIEWEYTGVDEEFKSIIMKDGSPTTSILTQTPNDAKFLAKDSNNIIVRPPVTANQETISWTMIIIGGVLVIIGIMITTVSLRYSNKGLRTIIKDE